MTEQNKKQTNPKVDKIISIIRKGKTLTKKPLEQIDIYSTDVKSK